MAQPYYQIDFSASHCQFEVRVNDISVLHMEITGQVSTMVPINPGILKSGKQTIAVKILPLSGQPTVTEHAEFNYDIKLFDVSNGFEFKEQLSGFRFPPVDKSKPHTELKHEAFFNAEVPYTVKDYDGAVDLTRILTIKQLLTTAYQQIGTLVDAGNYEGFRKAIALREGIMATTMYLSKGESDARIDDLVNDFKNGFKFESIQHETVMHFYANGRSAALKKNNGESALVFMNKQTGEELMIDVTFYIPAGNTSLQII